MTTQPDRERRQVYAADDLASEHTVLDEAQDRAWLAGVVAEVVGSSWWQTIGGGRTVALRQNRSRRRSYWDPSARLMSVSPEAMSLSTLVHELAHVVITDTGRPDWLHHGPQFRGAQVALRRLVLGEACAADLAEVYAQFGLAVDAAHWPKVSGSPVLDSDWYDGLRVQGRPGLSGPKPGRRPPIAL